MNIKLGRIFRKKNDEVKLDMSDFDDEAQFMMKSYSDDFDSRKLSSWEQFKEMFKLFWTERKENEKIRSENKELEKKLIEENKRAIEEIQKRDKEKEDVLLNKNKEIDRLNNTVQIQSKEIHKLRDDLDKKNEAKPAKEKSKNKKEQQQNPNKKVMARDAFRNLEDAVMFLGRLKEKYYVDFVFCAYMFFTLLRCSDAKLRKYLNDKQYAKRVKFDSAGTIKVIQTKTERAVQVLFPKKLVSILEEYFSRVEKENVFIDEDTSLFIEYERNKKQSRNLKNVVKRKMISIKNVNKHLQEVLETFHDEKKLLYLKLIGTHTWRISGARCYYLIGVAIEVIQSILGHKNKETTLLYMRIAADDRREAVEKLDEAINQLEQKFIRL